VRPGGKNAVATTGCKNTINDNHDPEVRPRSEVITPEPTKITLRVRFGPMRSVIHPERNEIPRVGIRESATSALAEDFSIPCPATR
jgi:hypothetical protein